MRNKLVYDTAQEVGLAYSPVSRYVDLYVDGIYYGLYLLMEKIDVAPTRINISLLQERTEAVNYRGLSSFPMWFSMENGLFRKCVTIPSNPDDITGGYLLELELDYRLWDNENAFVTESGQPISVKYPAQCSAEQLNYIADYYQEMENALFNGTYAQYIDVESWAKFYLVQEFFPRSISPVFSFIRTAIPWTPKSMPALCGISTGALVWAATFLGRESVSAHICSRKWPGVRSEH